MHITQSTSRHVDKIENIHLHWKFTHWFF